jgi:hypothetical protein
MAAGLAPGEDEASEVVVRRWLGRDDRRGITRTSIRCASEAPAPHYGHFLEAAQMAQDLEEISAGVVAWMARRPYHAVRVTHAPVFHTFPDCLAGLRIELRDLRRGDSGRDLCPKCRARTATKPAPGATR